MTLTTQQIFISHGYLSVPGAPSALPLSGLMENPRLLTVISNLSYYGYVPSIEAIRQLLSLSEKELLSFWKDAEAALKELTAANRKMDDFVVYKNFPREVLEMSQAEYWCKQILMYWGLDKELFTQPVAERPALAGFQNRKVLHLADANTLSTIWTNLHANKARWSAPQQEHAKFLLTHLKTNHIDVDTIAFKENAIQLVSHLLDTQPAASAAVNNATDVLRLAALRSEADVALRQPIKFKSFSRKERRFLCVLLQNSKNLESDMAERPALFKLLLRRLHPGDFKTLPRLHAAYNSLYQGQLVSFASKVEAGIIAAAANAKHLQLCPGSVAPPNDLSVLKLLASRPGDYARRLHKLYEVFGQDAIAGFIPVMDRLSNHQLVKLIKYVETANKRTMFTCPPKGNWTKLQLVPNTKTPFAYEAISALRNAATTIIRDRLQKMIPAGVDLDITTDLIKLQTNDSELASYGRGTIFPIPPEVTFLRTASYWENDPNLGVTWYDNGWNFFDANWRDKGNVCWSSTSLGRGFHDDYYTKGRKHTSQAAVFSGDPVNSKELKGRACQLIDLYIDRLLEMGIRYAVWNILCFSRKTFAEATGEVVASLQMGEKPETGNLYEPARATLVFPLKGKSMTKFIAYIDLEKRQLVYMDANLKGSTSGAGANSQTLSAQMPAFTEYLNSLPSVADLMLHADKGTVPVVYSDKDRAINDNQPAYVFRPENNSNQFQPVSIEKLL